MNSASTSDKPDASDDNDRVRRFSYSDAASARRATQQTSPIKMNVLLGKECSTLLVRM